MSTSYSAAVTITRPANTTAYAARDVLGAAISIPTIGASAGRIIITSVSLEINVTAIPAGMTSFLLYLYNVTPPSALADNAAFDIPSGDRASLLGAPIRIPTPVDEGSTLLTGIDAINKQVKLSGTGMFGYLVTEGAFTPAANSEVYILTVHSVGD